MLQHMTAPRTQLSWVGLEVGLGSGVGLRLRFGFGFGFGFISGGAHLQCGAPLGITAAHARRDDPAMRDEDAQQKEEEGEA
eukprot:scaffold101247_cov66-Phaeocystis_antarctica.AAC.4